ncbi:MAG: hypothetical protein KJO19_00220 [Woeseia sp.]|nr:hypothetical protein [Woeseia sp.]
MKSSQLIKHKSAVAAHDIKGNPQGKGSNGLLLDWNQSAPRGVLAKSRRQILAEFFTSMLVLSSTFKFRPAVGTANFLYWIDGRWCLSLIAPHQWSPERRAGFVGVCVLQQDMTWTISPSDQIAKGTPLSDALGKFYDGFAELMDTDLTLEDILPFHAANLPYHQRLYASALGRSIRAAVTLGDQTSLSCRQWNTLLPSAKNTLLAHKV